MVAAVFEYLSDLSLSQGMKQVFTTSFPWISNHLNQSALQPLRVFIPWADALG
jgi:hypothetical protein